MGCFIMSLLAHPILSWPPKSPDTEILVSPTKNVPNYPSLLSITCGRVLYTSIITGCEKYMVTVESDQKGVFVFDAVDLKLSHFRKVLKSYKDEKNDVGFRLFSSFFYLCRLFFCLFFAKACLVLSYFLFFFYP